MITLDDLRAEFGDQLKETKLVSGIYFLFRGKELVYIGQSSNILYRIGQHSKLKARMWKRAFYVEIRDLEKRRLRERRMIKQHRPILNGTSEIPKKMRKTLANQATFYSRP